MGEYEDRVTDEANRAMRKASGEVDLDDKLATFLYLLGRNELALGVIEEMVREAADEADQPCMFTNGYLARWASYTADRLR